MGALTELLKFVAKYGSKIVAVIKGAASVIGKYGTKAINWIKNNISLILDMIAALPTITDVIDWLTDKLNELFG